MVKIELKRDFRLAPVNLFFFFWFRQCTKIIATLDYFGVLSEAKVSFNPF